MMTCCVCVVQAAVKIFNPHHSEPTSHGSCSSHLTRTSPLLLSMADTFVGSVCLTSYVYFKPTPHGGYTFNLICLFQTRSTWWLFFSFYQNSSASAHKAQMLKWRIFITERSIYYRSDGKNTTVCECFVAGLKIKKLAISFPSTGSL